jgi:biopolymer transport protein ExbD
VDAQERLYFENQIVTERQLRASLAAAVRGARQPLTLIVHADKSVSYEKLAWLALLARQPEAGNTNLGITNLLFATLPRADVAPAKP